MTGKVPFLKGVLYGKENKNSSFRCCFGLSASC